MEVEGEKDVDKLRAWEVMETQEITESRHFTRGQVPESTRMQRPGIAPV